MPNFYALLTGCATFSARNTAREIVASVFVLFLSAFAKLFSKMLQTTMNPALLASAKHILMGTTEAGGLEYIDVLPAFLVLSSWLLMSGATAIQRFQKKHIDARKGSLIVGILLPGLKLSKAK